MGERWAARSAAIQIVTAAPQSVGLCEFISMEILHHTEFMIHSTVCHTQEAITAFCDVSYILEQSLAFQKINLF